MDEYQILLGLPYPLGAVYDGKGTNFAVFSSTAQSVELCLFSSPYGEEEFVKIPLVENNEVWHVYLKGIGPGQLYGFRVQGAFDPLAGLRHNANKLLLDPYAKATTPAFKWHSSLYAYPIGNSKKDLGFDEQDSGPHAPKGIVIDQRFDWKNDWLPNITNDQLIIYELHVKGFSKLNQQLPEELRGTYAGLAHPSSISYLKKLGVNAVELLPVHQFVSDHHLEEKGLCNYWGYNTIGFFAPHEAYASNRNPGAQVQEFKEMVDALHNAGIQVILDVVFNHTAEGNQLGPTLSLRGIDNQSYYRLEKDCRYYTDFTGTGNTLDTRSKPTLQLIADSLRYWVQEMHVDGFRFDLAVALARQDRAVDHNSAFFKIIHQDPVLSRVKLIAEPWDVGKDGYQVGKFAKPWLEWNGKYRDAVRHFWTGIRSQGKDFAERLLGSPDIYRPTGRPPHASINFVTAHDGFTLRDLVSYEKKHNEQNGDANEDGENDNRSTNCGIEGETDDLKVNTLQLRLQRSLLMTLLLSQGIPMICAGDEIGKTQQGNNNAYCQDNELSYLDWTNADYKLMEFTAAVIAMRQQYALFRNPMWLKDEASVKVAWFSLLGEQLDVSLKSINKRNTFGLLLVKDDMFYVCFNGSRVRSEFKLPDGEWKIMITSDEEVTPTDCSGSVILQQKAMVVLKSKNN